ncbi:hypothetical protein KP751_11470 [Streptococcus equi subsp. equi]|nr:hypothetical protein [Streptococcus equi subsp. equi]
MTICSKFYQQVKRKYPHSALTTTGHSLGAYLALIVAAEHKIPATTFNGPDPVRGMSAEAITWVKANSICTIISALILMALAILVPILELMIWLFLGMSMLCSYQPTLVLSRFRSLSF